MAASIWSRPSFWGAVATALAAGGLAYDGFLADHMHATGPWIAPAKGILSTFLAVGTWLSARWARVAATAWITAGAGLILLGGATAAAGIVALVAASLAIVGYQERQQAARRVMDVDNRGQRMP